MKTYFLLLVFFLTTVHLLTACKKDNNDLTSTNGIVEGPLAGCGFWVILYGDSVGVNSQRITAVNLPTDFQKIGLQIRFRIEEGIAPQIVCNAVQLPPPPPRYVSDVQLR